MNLCVMGLKGILVTCLVAVLRVETVSGDFYTSGSNVVNLHPSNFKSQVEDGDGVWLVEFYAPWCGHCKQFTPEWEKAATALKGIVNVGAVDAANHQSLGSRYGVQSFPRIKIFGVDKKRPVDYNSPRDAKSIVGGAIKAAKDLALSRLKVRQKKSDKTKSKKSGSSGSKRTSSSDVVTLTDDSFDSLVMDSNHIWLVEFYAPWCGHCKALAPEWEAAASELKGSVKVAALDATVHTKTSNRYDIKGFPTIKAFRQGAQSSKDAQDYQGPRQTSDIVKFALNLLEQSGGSLKVPQLTSQQVFDEHCSEDGKHVCVVAFMPNIIDSGKTNREGYIHEVKLAVKATTGMPFRFFWTVAGDHEPLENLFGLTFGFPCLVVVNRAKKLYSVQLGAFRSQAMKTFLNELTGGLHKTTPFETMPAIRTVEEWDGEEGKLEIEEDLDDNIMRELLGEIKHDEF